MSLIIATKAALLQELTFREGYGLELIDRIKEKSSGRLTLLQGRVYPALRELESEGLLKSWEGEPVPERGGRPRRFYKLTALGRKAAVEQRETVGAVFGMAPGVA